jgi:hypothetical protein
MNYDAADTYCPPWKKRNDPRFDGPFSLIRALLLDGRHGLVPRLEKRSCHNVNPVIFECNTRDTTKEALRLCVGCPCLTECSAIKPREGFDGCQAGQLYGEARRFLSSSQHA